MAGLKPSALYTFYRLLHARGETTITLGQKIGRNAASVSRVLNGLRRRGPIWHRLKPLLTAEEIRLLDVAECDTWNSHRLAKRPRWTTAKQRSLAA